MTEFAWHGYTVEVDEPATRAWYAQAGDWGCDCGHCRNFLALAKERRLPEELLNILDGLGIPPEKATYVCELYHDESWQEKGLHSPEEIEKGDAPRRAAAKKRPAVRQGGDLELMKKVYDKVRRG